MVLVQVRKTRTQYVTAKTEKLELQLNSATLIISYGNLQIWIQDSKIHKLWRSSQVHCRREWWNDATPNLGHVKPSPMYSMYLHIVYRFGHCRCWPNAGWHTSDNGTRGHWLYAWRTLKWICCRWCWEVFVYYGLFLRQLLNARYLGGIVRVIVDKQIHLWVSD